MSDLSKKVYNLNLGVPKDFEDMSAYSAYLGNGVVSLEKRISELEAENKRLQADAQTLSNINNLLGQEGFERQDHRKYIYSEVSRAISTLKNDLDAATETVNNYREKYPQVMAERDELEAENKRLKIELEHEKRSNDVFETTVDQVGDELAGIEDEFVHFPEAVGKVVAENKRLREALQAIIKHHNIMMNGDMHTTTWHIATKALEAEDE